MQIDILIFSSEAVDWGTKQELAPRPAKPTTWIWPIATDVDWSTRFKKIFGETTQQGEWVGFYNNANILFFKSNLFTDKKKVTSTSTNESLFPRIENLIDNDNRFVQVIALWNRHCTRWTRTNYSSHKNESSCHMDLEQNQSCFLFLLFVGVSAHAEFSSKQVEMQLKGKGMEYLSSRHIHWELLTKQNTCVSKRTLPWALAFRREADRSEEQDRLKDHEMRVSQNHCIASSVTTRLDKEGITGLAKSL